MSDKNSGSPIEHVFAGVATADYKSALAWYTRLLGRPPDVIVREDEAMWQVAEASWIYVTRDSKRAGKALLTMLVDDLDMHVASLTERGISTGAMETEPGLYRKVVIADPDGNLITFGEDLSKSQGAAAQPTK
jgi:catechol 2,3-dioxygenase-like lactoylglutathione lyase family enzyme